MLRIAFDARYVNNTYHGVGRVAFRLIDALTSLAPGVDFVVARGSAPNDRFDWRDVASRPNVHIFDADWPVNGLSEQIAWPGALNRLNADALLSPWFVAPLAAAIPVVITVHDLTYQLMPSAYPGGRASRLLYDAVLAASLRKAARVIVGSQSAVSDLSGYSWGQKAARKTSVVRWAADETWRPLRSGQAREVARKYGLERPYVLCVGAHRPHKNQAGLVRAFSRALDYVDADLVLVGQIDPRFPSAACAIASASPRLAARVRFLEWVPERDMPALYSAASCVAVPSLIEGFGLPVLEAMSRGTPVLASCLSAVSEVAGEAALLVDPRDESAFSAALIALLGDPELRETLAARGLARAAEFSWRETAEGWLRAIEDALGKKIDRL